MSLYIDFSVHDWISVRTVKLKSVTCFQANVIFKWILYYFRSQTLIIQICTDNVFFSQIKEKRTKTFLFIFFWLS